MAALVLFLYAVLKMESECIDHPRKENLYSELYSDDRISGNFPKSWRGGSYLEPLNRVYGDETAAPGC
jgi:hypothetical protein